MGVAEAFLRKAKGHVHQKLAEQSKAKPVVLPYIHRVMHNLKKVAERYKVPVVFSAPRKLAACAGCACFLASQRGKSA